MVAHPKPNHGDPGTTLIEMMIALLVLTIGLLGCVPMFSVAIANNYRSRTDSTSTALAEMVLDQIAAIPVGSSTTTVSVTDCAGNTTTINTAGSSTGTGANLSSGNIDFTQSFSAITSGYAMHYTVCSSTNSINAVYDLRWNVQTVPSGNADFVVVGARLGTSTGLNANPLLYAPPVSVRTIAGNSGN